MEFLIFLGSGAVLLGLAFVVWMTVTKHRMQGIANWPYVDGQIVKAQVSMLERETPAGIERTYTPVLSYAYAVDGLSYTSRRLNFLPDSSATYTDGKLAQAAIAPYPPGAQAKVYYNPANPRQSALQKPRPTAHNAVILYGVVAMIAGACIIALGIVL
ncbi:MAG: DUF3592 domain-containing protein [Anaerolineae bacterium]|jgi:hypothetical protein|nr:DUF3592 domain-containing protein [Anaerolineae bacterium]